MQFFGSHSFKVGLAIRSIGQGPNLVLVHGGSGSRTHWFNNVEKLCASFTVITLDLPGFGESAKPPASVARTAEPAAASAKKAPKSVVIFFIL